MLSYQHIYHAGNFADVQKHAALALLLQVMAIKPQKFGVLDTHAGRGMYDLESEEAIKVGEFTTGIVPFWLARGTDKTPLSALLDVVAKFNEGDTLRYYPGSAKLAQSFMRAGDRLTLIERHPGEAGVLRQNMADAKGVTIEQKDGFACLVDMVPLPERRGMVVIDPSYEIKSEYKDLPRQLQRAWKKWPQGQFVIWYPMLEAGLHREMLTALRQSDIKDMLVSEIRIEEPAVAQERVGMYGSGLIIINPPFGFEAALRELTTYIAARLPGKKVDGRVFWLDNRPIDPETGYVSETF